MPPDYPARNSHGRENRHRHDDLVLEVAGRWRVSLDLVWNNVCFFLLLVRNTNDDTWKFSAIMYVGILVNWSECMQAVEVEPHGCPKPNSISR